MIEGYTISGNIIINTSFIGFHKWPDAPDEFDYLRNLHRHVFHVKMKWPVGRLNRELEFINMKNLVDELLELRFFLDEDSSCEQICCALLEEFPEATYCRVMEDNENGAEMSRCRHISL